MKQLPENWEQLSHQEKDIFFTKYYINFVRDGEYDGINEWAPNEVKEAYEAFLKEKYD